MDVLKVSHHSRPLLNSDDERILSDSDSDIPLEPLPFSHRGRIKDGQLPTAGMSRPASTAQVSGGERHRQNVVKADSRSIKKKLNALAHPSPLALFSLSFFLLGLLNNSLYVVILTSALELIPQGVPTGSVALANIGPALIAKAIWPYVLKGRVRYARRVWCCTALSTTGMLVIAFIPVLPVRLLGISMASFSSGLGELTWLQLCTRYGPLRAGRGVGWFASGTGAAGLFGAAAWWIVRPLGVKTGLSLMSLLPLLMAASHFLLLPTIEDLKEYEVFSIFAARGGGYQAVPSETFDVAEHEEYHADELAEDTGSTARRGLLTADSLGTLHAPTLATLLPRGLEESISKEDKAIKLSFKEKIDLLKPMLLPFILPLVLVYLFEYTINQGVAPTLLYSVPKPSEHLLLSWFIKNLHDYYPLYQLTYQAFVFLSRSSLSLLQVPPIPRSLLWLPAVVQLAILILLTSESLYAWFRESLARSLCMVFVGVEGLAGGWAYVSVFYRIGTTQREARPLDLPSVDAQQEAELNAGDGDLFQAAREDLLKRAQEQEFRVGCVGVGDSTGILVASLVSMPLQLALCGVQVSLGRNLCRQV